MSTPARLLAFSGSIRKASFNRKLIAIAAAAARAAGAEVTELDLAEYELPIYHGDLEAQGMPANARRLKDVFLAHTGLLLSCPEYNSGITPLLKNTIDWVSRPTPGERPLAGFSGKVAALMSASTGSLGGLRGLLQVRTILSNIGVLVLPDQVAVPNAAEAFDAGGALKDAAVHKRIEALAARAAEVTRKLNA